MVFGLTKGIADLMMLGKDIKDIIIIEILIVTLTDHPKMVSFHGDDNYFTKTKPWLNICILHFRIILIVIKGFN